MSMYNRGMEWNKVRKGDDIEGGREKVINWGVRKSIVEEENIDNIETHQQILNTYHTITTPIFILLTCVDVCKYIHRLEHVRALYPWVVTRGWHFLLCLHSPVCFLHCWSNHNTHCLEDGRRGKSGGKGWWEADVGGEGEENGWGMR